jgi:hypothetical protein
LNVQKHQVGREEVDTFDRFDPVATFPDNLDIRGVFEPNSQAAAGDLLVALLLGMLHLPGRCMLQIVYHLSIIRRTA